MNIHTLPHRHPRWLIVTFACGLAILYACILLAANIPPRWDQKHGWPFVYMVREWRVPGPFTIVYGPWPFDAPPLVEFRTAALALDCAIGILLTFAAPIVVTYWLRHRPTLVQFSLRTLFVLTAAVACLVAVAKLLALKWLGVLWVFVYWGVYIVPAALIFTVAHWIVCRPRTSRLQVRWCGLHWVTWLALVSVGGPCFWYQGFTRTGVMYVGSEKTQGAIGLESFGWPTAYRADLRWPDRTWAEGDGFPTSYFDPGYLAANILVWLAIVAATGFVVERWIRRTQRGDRFRPASVLAMIIATGATAWILQRDQFFDPAFLAYFPLLAGIASAVYSAEVAVVWGTKSLLSNSGTSRR